MPLFMKATAVSLDGTKKKDTQFWWKIVLESNHLEDQIRWDIIKLDFRGLVGQEERL